MNGQELGNVLWNPWLKGPPGKCRVSNSIMWLSLSWGFLLSPGVSPPSVSGQWLCLTGAHPEHHQEVSSSQMCSINKHVVNWGFHRHAGLTLVSYPPPSPAPVNLGSPKLILFPPLGQEDSNIVLEMSIVCKPSGPEKWGEVMIEGRADRCVRKEKWTLLPALPTPLPRLPLLGQQS